MAKKYVYFFGAGAAEGNMKMKDILGGKGANLAEMAGLGLPVPPGFTVSTEVCALYYKNKRKIPEPVRLEVEKNLKKLEKTVGQSFGDPKDPLLVSVRSGGRASMPGMMDTILNPGPHHKTAATAPTARARESLVPWLSAATKEKPGHDFPADPVKQLWGAIGAVFSSWMNDRAIAYRKVYDIPEAWGTAVNIQLMVFGNMGSHSETRVALTREAAT